jgi:hypothetical protein
MLSLSIFTVLTVSAANHSYVMPPIYEDVQHFYKGVAPVQTGENGDLLTATTPQ